MQIVSLKALKAGAELLRRLRIRPAAVLTIFLMCIILFAFLYWLFPDATTAGPSFLRSVYFSVVTITTLGYGDIVPASNFGMLLIILEAIFGVVLIGLFLNSLWQSYAARIEEHQSEILNAKIKSENLQRLAIYSGYLFAIIADYKLAFFELTTPLKARSQIQEPDPKFKFSDMQDMYGISILTANGFFKPVIRTYYEKQDTLVDELKYLMANFNLHEYRMLYFAVVSFLIATKRMDVRGALFSYEQINSGTEKMKETLKKMISEHDECPDLEKYKSNVITPAIVLFLTLKSQINELLLIEKQLRQIVPHGNTNFIRPSGTSP
jgi:hypothetical protein